MPVGGGLFFGKVAGFKPVALLENGLLCGYFWGFCLNFECTFFSEQLWVAAFIIIAIYYGILVYSLEFQYYTLPGFHN